MHLSLSLHSGTHYTDMFFRWEIKLNPFVENIELTVFDQPRLSAFCARFVQIQGQSNNHPNLQMSVVWKKIKGFFKRKSKSFRIFLWCVKWIHFSDQSILSVDRELFLQIVWGYMIFCTNLKSKFLTSCVLISAMVYSVSSNF